MQFTLTRASATVCRKQCQFIPLRYGSWFAAEREQGSNNGASWYNPNPTPKSQKSETYKNISGLKTQQKVIPKHTSTNPPRGDHCQGYYTFFRDLEHGFKHITWPKNDESKFNPDWMEGFKVIENYISQEEHDKFLAEVMEYSRTSHKVTHFDGRLVMNEMDTDFYPLFFNRLVNDGILEGPDRLAPNIYANGDGIPPHFDRTVCSIGVGGSDVIRFVNTRTGETKEVTVPPSRYSCVHLIEPKPRKVPRISLVVEPDLGLTEFRDFNMMGSYGVWRHLDELRGHTTLRQKVDLLTQFGKQHFPKQLPFFEKRFQTMAEYADKHNL